MSRVLKVVALAAVVSLAVVSVALASLTKVTGGTSTVTASSAAVKLLSDNHITVKALAPATQSGSTLTFPITGGRVNTKTFRGIVVNGGGVSFSNGTKTVALHKPTIVSTKKGVALFAAVRGRSVRVCHRIGRHAVRCLSVSRFVVVRVANVTNTSVSGNKATGTLKITAFSAGVINRLAGKKVAAAGDVLGTGTVSPTLK